MNQDPDIKTDPGERPQRPPEGVSSGILLVLAAVVIGGVLAAWGWRSQHAAPTPAPAVQPASQAAAAGAVASAVVAPDSAIKYPLPQPEASEQPLAAEDIPAALTDLLGQKAVITFLQTDDFVRRIVATIDNLGRDHAPVAAWPVQPTGGQFTVEDRPDGPVISTENASRYTPFVLLVGTLDVPKAVSLYRRMYPLLQQAYRQLGLGDRYLNDRIVEVIDLLLATPEPPEPPRLQLTDVKGPYPSTRPWVRYQFADPELEHLSAGQKILLRVGLVNEHRLKAKLAEFRAQIVGTTMALPTPPAVPSSGPSSGPVR